MKLEGKVAIVTGAGGGIGRAVALRLAQEGADVVANDINMGTAKSTADEIKATGHKALAIKADVTKSKEVGEMFETALRELGKVDILVNVAGGSAREKASAFRDSEEETWDSVLGNNLKGTLICSRAVINHMIERGTGKIVNIASAAGVYGCTGVADYSAAKAGVIGFTRALASEVGEYGINVNSVAPGPIRTSGLLFYPEEIVQATLAARIIKRMGEPDEIASAVLFLASDDANYITGQTLLVDGGTKIF